MSDENLKKKYSWEFIILIAIVSILIIGIIGVVVALVSQPNEQNGSGGGSGSGSGGGKSLLEFCSATDRPDKLSEASNGNFSCCGHNQVCDLKWWDEYAPTIGQDNLTYITSLLGVEYDDFVANSDTRYAAHASIVNDVCPETCNTFRTKTFFKSLSESDESNIEISNKVGDILSQGGFIPEMDVHTGECILACNSSANCNNVMYVNIGDNYVNEDGLCVYLDDSTTEEVIEIAGMTQLLPNQSPLSSDAQTYNITIFRR